MKTKTIINGWLLFVATAITCVMCVFCLCLSCEEKHETTGTAKPTDFNWNQPISAFNITHKGHEYIGFMWGPHSSGVVHNPECTCNINRIPKIPQIK
jgi:hypothetical protein